MPQTHLTESNIRALLSSEVWKEIVRRVEQEVTKQDVLIERADSFEHGCATGARRSLRMLLGLPQQLLDEVNGSIAKSVKGIFSR